MDRRCKRGENSGKSKREERCRGKDLEEGEKKERQRRRDNKEKVETVVTEKSEKPRHKKRSNFIMLITFES